MFKDLLVQFPLINLVLVGQLLFFAIFIGALAWVFRPGSNEFYENLARMPQEREEGSRE